MRHARLLAAGLLSLTVGMFATTAQAGSGCVRVKVEYHNMLKHSCDNPSGTPGLCTGALYLASDFDRALPIAEANVRLRTNTGFVIGVGSTNTAGIAIINWTQNGASDAYGRLEVDLAHKDDRFRVVPTAGATPFRRYQSYRWFHNQNVTPCTIPVEAGTMTLGSASVQDDAAHAYAAAEMAWQNAFKLSNRLLAEFNDVEIVTSQSRCPVGAVACASRHPNQDYSPDPYPAPMPEPKGAIFLAGPATGYLVAVVAHELGHLANYFSHSGADYLGMTPESYGGSAGWLQKSPEYASLAFEEGLANFWAVRTLYNSTAEMPYSCQDVDAVNCPDPGASFAVLASTDLDPGGCAEGDQKARWPITTTRFLWDVYDNEPTPDENISRPISTFVDTLFAYGNGYGNHQKDEVAGLIWVMGMPFVIQEDPDGRSSWDFHANHQTTYGVSLQAAHTLNCSSPGD